MSARQIDHLTDVPPLARTTMPLRVGKYRIVRVLGEGAMGVVYQGHDAAIDRPVAIKTIRRALLAPHAQDLEPIARFRNEAQAAGRLNHPNIVAVYEYGEDAGVLFLAMEFVDGVPLVECTGRSVRLPLADVACLMAQLLDALHAAHEQGVVHRDVKPANLLVTPDGRLKVTDFGIARVDSNQLTRMSAVMGSPGYMAPERYTDEAPDRRVDIFSAGVLLYELLTGAAPFMGSQDAVMAQVLHKQPPAPSRLPIRQAPPAALDAVIARAIAKRPEARFASAQEMRDAMLAAVGLTEVQRLSREACAQLMALGGRAAATRNATDARAAPAAPQAIAPADGPSHAHQLQGPGLPAPIQALVAAAGAHGAASATWSLERGAPRAAPRTHDFAAAAPQPSGAAALQPAAPAPAASAPVPAASAPVPAALAPVPAALAPSPALVPADATPWAGLRVEPIWHDAPPSRPTAAQAPAAAWPPAAAMRRQNTDAPPVPPGAALAPAAAARGAAVEPAPRPQTAPSAASAEFLARLESLLLPVIGPMAGLTVRHAARRLSDPLALVQHLADDAVAAEERDAFLLAARGLLPNAAAVGSAPQAASRPAPPAGPLPVLGSTPMKPGDEQHAQSVLARRVGPIATLFVRRAAARARTREEFYVTLADLSEECVDRKALLKDLWRAS